MTAFRPTHLTLALGAALSALLCAPVHAQSLMELVESARTYDTTWQAARAQLEAAARRADQAQAGLRPSAALTSGVTRAQFRENARLVGIGGDGAFHDGLFREFDADGNHAFVARVTRTDWPTRGPLCLREALC